MDWWPQRRFLEPFSQTSLRHLKPPGSTQIHHAQHLAAQRFGTAVSITAFGTACEVRSPYQQQRSPFLRSRHILVSPTQDSPKRQCLPHSQNPASGIRWRMPTGLTPTSGLRNPWAVGLPFPETSRRNSTHAAPPTRPPLSSEAPQPGAAVSTSNASQRAACGTSQLPALPTPPPCCRATPAAGARSSAPCPSSHPHPPPRHTVSPDREPHDPCWAAAS